MKNDFKIKTMAHSTVQYMYSVQSIFFEGIFYNLLSFR